MPLLNKDPTLIFYPVEKRANLTTKVNQDKSKKKSK